MIKILTSRRFYSRRGALDIGSGSIKCAIADVKNNIIVNRLYNSNQEVLFMNDFFAKGELSSEIIEKGALTLGDFRQKMT